MEADSLTIDAAFKLATGALFMVGGWLWKGVADTQREHGTKVDDHETRITRNEAGRGELMRRLDRIENKLDRALNGTNRGR